MEEPEAALRPPEVSVWGAQAHTARRVLVARQPYRRLPLAALAQRAGVQSQTVPFAVVLVPEVRRTQQAWLETEETEEPTVAVGEEVPAASVVEKVETAAQGSSLSQRTSKHEHIRNPRRSRRLAGQPRAMGRQHRNVVAPGGHDRDAGQ